MPREQNTRGRRRCCTRLAAVLAAVPAVLLAPTAAHGDTTYHLVPQQVGQAKLTGDSERRATLRFTGSRGYYAYFCISDRSRSNPSVKLKYHFTNGDTYVTRSWGTGGNGFLCHEAWRGEDPHTGEPDPNPLPPIRSITVYLTTEAGTSTFNYVNRELGAPPPPPPPPPDGHPPAETGPASDDETEPEPSGGAVQRVVIAGPKPDRTPPSNPACLRSAAPIRVRLTKQERDISVTRVVFIASQVRTNGDDVPRTREVRSADARGPFEVTLRPGNRFVGGSNIRVTALVTRRLTGPFPLDERPTHTKRFFEAFATCR